MLYRKYRPQKFSDIVGQEHVIKTLLGTLKSGRIGHAYLFAGSRGTGKTSVARLFAKALNCFNLKIPFSDSGSNNKTKILDFTPENTPCNECYNCISANKGNLLDLIEIDAASNRGIDEIRNLKESAMVSSSGGGYKVFIIDEVHMLTKDAFNALLKILEEPPSHVIFILATTEPHKILPTVLSRVQRFDFKRLNHEQIYQKLKMMSDKENIKITDEAIKTIAVSADGALRDAEVALSKVQTSLLSSKEITVDEVNEVLGFASYKLYPELVGYILKNDRINALNLIQKIYMAGTDLENFTGNLVEYIRNILMAKINPVVLASVGGFNKEELKNISIFSQAFDEQKLIKMIVSFSTARNEIKYSSIPQLPLELAIVNLTSL
jgi:DNA polymerase-3 subunit gamma/tau